MNGPGAVERYLIESSRRGPICAALIDPEDFTPAEAADTAREALSAGVKLLLVGGSTLSDQTGLDRVVSAIREVTRDITTSPETSQKSPVPVILFPGNVTGVSKFADAILFSSLLNSTNPYFIIGAQALGAMEVYKAKIESIPMGYLVFGRESATGFVGQVNPLPSAKPSLAVIYALASKYLGMRALYLEGGSGASEPVPPDTIRAVRKFYDGLLITGGGIVSPERARSAARAGADLIVIGNLLQSPGYQETLRGIISASEGRRAPKRV